MIQQIFNALNVTLTVMLPIFAVIALAALFSRWMPLDARTLSRLAVYIFTPALVFQNTVEANFESGELRSIFLMAILSSVVLLVLAWGLAKLFHFEHKLESGFMMSVLISNAGFLGFPVVEYSFGVKGLQYAAVFFAVVNVITNSIGIYISSLGELSVKASLKNVFQVPLIYATALGLWLNLNAVPVPLPVMRSVTLLGQATVPCSMVLLGLQMASTHIKTKVAPIVLASAVRLLVAPLIAFGLAACLGISGLPAQVMITQLSMPTALFAAVFAVEFGSDAGFVTSTILVTTLASILTLSILLGVFL